MSRVARYNPWPTAKAEAAGLQENLILSPWSIAGWSEGAGAGFGSSYATSAPKHSVPTAREMLPVAPARNPVSDSSISMFAYYGRHFRSPG